MTTPFYGTWARKGGQTFVFKMVFYQYDDTVAPPVLWKAVGREKVTVDPGGDSYNGQGTIEWYDSDGNFAGVVDSVTHGVRIKAE